MKRLAVVAIVVLSLAACGGAGSKSVVLRAANPGRTAAYLKLTGSSNAATAVAALLEHASKGVLVSAPGVQGRQVCARTTHIITYPVSPTRLRPLGGQKITFALYSNSPSANEVGCQGFLSDFKGGITLVGENRRTFHVPSSAMEPTLHCAKPATGCLGTANDVVVIRSTGAKGLKRGAIVVFTTPKAAVSSCGAAGTFVKRVIGLPSETVREDDQGFVWIRASGSATWMKLSEAYVSAAARRLDSEHRNQHWHVPAGAYFVLGDNRSESCDSRYWGSVPAANIAGPVTQIIRGDAVLRPAGTPG